MLMVFSEKIIYIDICEKKIDYHQEIFCQLIRFFISLCSYLFQKFVSKIKVLPKISIELYTSFSKTNPVCSVNTN